VVTAVLDCLLPHEHVIVLFAICEFVGAAKSCVTAFWSVVLFLCWP
jgi:hypothetical protein